MVIQQLRKKRKREREKDGDNLNNKEIEKKLS